MRNFMKFPYIQSLSCLGLLGTSQCSLQHKLEDDFQFPGQLVQIQVVHRHAARTPLTTRYLEGTVWNNCQRIYLGVETSIRNKQGGGPRPTSAFDLKQENTVFPGNCSMGTLTEEGQRQAIQLGLWLREKYIEQHKLLTPLQSTSQIYCQSTNYRRTLSTLHGILAGLYPKVDSSVPFLIQTLSDESEYITGNEQLCKRYGQFVAALTPIENKWDLTSETKTKYPNWKQMVADIRKVMGIGSDEKIHWMDLHDSIACLDFHNKKMRYDFTPEQTLFINVEAINRFKIWLALSPPELADNFQSPAQLSLGLLLNELLENIYRKINNLQSHKIFFYSGHDTTIIPLLITLDQEIETWTPFMSNVIVELWHADKVDQVPQPQKQTQPQSKPKNLIQNVLIMDLQNEAKSISQELQQEVKVLSKDDQQEQDQVQQKEQSKQQAVSKDSKKDRKQSSGTKKEQENIKEDDQNQNETKQETDTTAEKDIKSQSTAKQEVEQPISIPEGFEQNKYYIRILYNQEPLFKDVRGGFIDLDSFISKIQRNSIQLQDMKKICNIQN